ncbi:MAG: hypothetical protein IH840_16050 [Candidatus Heimdallarchaeota archaeon]|nr:hypothetical protein [Candidatus Heimdallarchaeota archaeon]
MSSEFLREYRNLKLKQSDTIGLDVNRVGPYVLVFSQKIDVSGVLSTICERYTKLAAVISKLSAAISKTRNEGSINRSLIL